VGRSVHAEADKPILHTRDLGWLAVPTDEGDEVAVEVDGMELAAAEIGNGHTVAVPWSTPSR
jgi:hypothetical protein